MDPGDHLPGLCQVIGGGSSVECVQSSLENVLDFASLFIDVDRVRLGGLEMLAQVDVLGHLLQVQMRIAGRQTVQTESGVNSFGGRSSGAKETDAQCGCQSQR